MRHFYFHSKFSFFIAVSVPTATDWSAKRSSFVSATLSIASGSKDMHSPLHQVDRYQFCPRPRSAMLEKLSWFVLPPPRRHSISSVSVFRNSRTSRFASCHHNWLMQSKPSSCPANHSMRLVAFLRQNLSRYESKSNLPVHPNRRLRCNRSLNGTIRTSNRWWQPRRTSNVSNSNYQTKRSDQMFSLCPPTTHQSRPCR